MFLRHKNSYFAIGAIAIVFLTGVLFFNYEKNNTPEAEAAAADNVMGFAWSENIGWISFNSMECDTNNNGFIDIGACGGNDNATTPSIDYGVNLNADNTLSGYAWSSNIGWISFNRADTGVPPGAPYNGAETHIAKLDGADNLTGWARALSFGGGWDGWIKLRKDPFVAPAYGVNLNGTDFEGFAWGDMVVGWVSFNSKNCDTDNNTFVDAGACGGDNTTTPVVNYKVYLGNNPPIVSNLNILPIDYCKEDLGDIEFQWSFNDVEDGSGNQTAYQIYLERDGGGLGNTCSINGTANLFIKAATINLPANCPGFIDYGHNNYEWSVTVWDSGGLSDTEIYTGLQFDTPDHQYPIADFNYIPLTPVPQFQNIDFDPGPSQTFGGSFIAQWTWDFGDGTAFRAIVPPLTGDTAYSYAEPDGYTVDLKITDSDGNSCWASDSGNAEDIDVELSKPTWNEVEPESNID